MRTVFIWVIAAMAAAAAVPALSASTGRIDVESGLRVETPPHLAAAVTPPSSARGTEITLPEEAVAGIPAVNLPAPTLYPTTTARPTTAPPRNEWERRGHAALDRISYDWRSRLSEWEFVFLPGRRGVIGLTFVTEHRIEIYVRDDMSDGLLAHVIAHEMGHAVDVTLNSSSEREQWQAERGIGSAPWWPGDGATDFSTGAGDFAESFAYWQLPSSHFRSTLAGPPDRPELELMADLASG